MQTPISLAALIIAVAIAYASGQTDRNALFIKPSRVDADKAFVLEVLSFRWNCGATYSHIESAAAAGRLDIRFAVTENPAAICPAIEKPYGPKVPVKALPAGRYDVWATPLLPCQVAPQPCEVPEKPERAGILTVGRQADADWFVSPAATAAGKAFDLRILNERYGNCQTSFDHESLAVRDGRIVASFVIRTDTTLVCIVDIHPHGPAFHVEALKAGKYPVDVIETPACIYEKPVCPWLPPDLVARTVDTLLVTGTNAALASGRDLAHRPAVRLERGRLRIGKSAGAETRSLHGRILGPVLP